MTAVAMVIRNRMAAQNISLRTAIYKQQQFEPARNGSLTNYLTGIAEQSSSIINQLKIMEPTVQWMNPSRSWMHI